MNGHKLVGLGLACLLGSSWPIFAQELSDREEELTEFLIAREAAWLDSFPETLGVREWGEGVLGLFSWEGVMHGAELNLEHHRYDEGASPSDVFKVPGNRHALLVYSGQKYLHVEYAPRMPGSSEPPHWDATIATELPTRAWRETMTYNLRRPLERETLAAHARSHPPVRVTDHEDTIIALFAAHEDIAGTLRGEESLFVRGYLGLEVTFDKHAGWRPTLIRFCFDPGSEVSEPAIADLERVSFGTRESIVLRTLKWSDWVPCGAVLVPTTRVETFHGRLDGPLKEFIPGDGVWPSHLDLQAMDALPEGVSFSLDPPPIPGTTGTLVNRDSKAVDGLDYRTPLQRERAREAEIKAMVNQTEAGPAEPPRAPPGSWWSWLLLLGGAGLIGLGLGRLLLRRGPQARTTDRPTHPSEPAPGG
ncbi:MAG TPA: hypothetical protein EYQ25_01330 [Planctomycetes bacterium]|nr:hypothetical protein [Planctomycetota bacterium]HIL38417.1 hypothetical protein [Planctomycetota bacterium]